MQFKRFLLEQPIALYAVDREQTSYLGWLHRLNLVLQRIAFHHRGLSSNLNLD